MSKEQLMRSLAHKNAQQLAFNRVSHNKRMQRFNTAIRKGQLTNRQRAFLKRQSRIAQINRQKQAAKVNAKITVDKYFDRVFILNMSRQMDKWYNMVNRMKRFGITNYERFNAIDGGTEPYLSQWTAYSKKPFNKFDKKYGRKAIRSPGVWGILNSMKKMFLVAKKRGYKNFLVLQDDAILHHDFVNMFDQKIRKIPPWRMLFLGVTQYSYRRDMLQAKDFYYPLGLADGAYAVAFNESIYNFVIKQINQFVMPFDSGPLMTVQRTFPRECVVINPLLIIADVRSSSCRSGRDQEKFCKKVRWNYANHIEYTSVPDNAMVTVVMVTENSARYVADAIYSIVHQTYKNLELIIFDNASEDNTISLIKSLKNKMKNKSKVKLYRSQKKMSDSVYKNMGMMIAQGSAITFQEPDCKSISSRIEKQMILLKRNNGVVTVGYKHDMEGNVEQSVRSMMISKKIIDEIGYFELADEGYEREYYNKVQHCKMPTSAIKEIYYIPYAALSENLNDSEAVSLERAAQINKYHEWLDTRKGPKYRQFPPKNTRDLYKDINQVINSEI